MRRVFLIMGVAALIVIMDRALGAGFGWLYRKTHTGEFGGLINDALSRKTQVLLLGSSRMRHHVMPAVLNSKLSLTAYNAGMDGQDFLYAMMLFDLWQRSNAPPKAIVLNIDPESFERSEEELQRAGVFSFYYDASPLVRQVLNQRSRFECLKFLSRAYRANGKVLAIGWNLFSHPAANFDGFEPLTGCLSPQTPGAPRETIPTTTEFWSLKVQCFNRLADYCRKHGTRLFLVEGPRYREDPRAHEARVNVLSKFLAGYPEAELIDLCTCTHPEVFQDKAELFRDGTHLNAHGAEIFSTMLAEALQTRLHSNGNLSDSSITRTVTIAH
ncbi:MAG: hypothetical protein C5B50_16580 [Verrucomicrobia bacterium]|nr:MAG: hypothetical protein C5B50_16580 [Verrucomicrobiota bacterium]